MNHTATKALVIAGLLSMPIAAQANPFLGKDGKSKAEYEAEISQMKSEISNMASSLKSLLDEQSRIQSKQEEMASIEAEMMAQGDSSGLPPEPPSNIGPLFNPGSRLELTDQDIPNYYSGFIQVNGEYILRNEDVSGSLPYVSVSPKAYNTRVIQPSDVIDTDSGDK